MPEAIGQLAQLQLLYLNQNQLLEVPVVVGQLTQLRTLDLKRNKWESLPQWLTSSPNCGDCICMATRRLAFRRRF